jgi:hypothetical protein
VVNVTNRSDVTMRLIPLKLSYSHFTALSLKNIYAF